MTSTRSPLASRALVCGGGGILLALTALCAAAPVAAYSTSFVNVATSAGTENPGGIGDPLNPIDLTGSGLAWADWISTMHMWGGVAIDDYDRDSDPDIYLTNNGANALYRNDGNWTFTEVAAAAGVATAGRSMGATWGDYDNDGCRDLFVASFTGPSSLYRSQCDGTFTNATATANISINFRAAGAAWGDYDRDGDLDLAVSCYVSCPNELLRNNGDGTFTRVGAALGVADPGWTFQPVWVDYDQDGDIDLWDVNDFGYDKIYRNNDNGTFTEVALLLGVDREGAGGMGITVGDIDGDGWFDYFETNFYNDSIYRSTHGGLDESFTGSPINDPLVGWGTTLFDAENDGDVDLFIANGFIFNTTHNRFQDVKFLENNGIGIFSNASADLDAVYGGVSHGAATADFDGDGDLDLFVFSLTGPSMLFRNDGAKGNWLKLNLTGTVSNRDALGAIVTAIAGGRTIARFQMSASSYLSQSEHMLHFGLGNASLVDSLTIEWPSGARQVLLNLSANASVNVTEPPSLIARAGGDYPGRPSVQVDLDGWATTDPLDGTFPAGANFTWTVDLGGTTDTLYGPTPNITLAASGAYRGSLRVRDSLGNVDDDPFMIYVRDERAPTARAGPDQSVCDAAPIVLDGGASTDNDPAFTVFGKYTWAIPLVTGTRLVSGVRVTVTIDAPSTYDIPLSARDPTGNEGTDSLIVVVRDCTPPTVTVPANIQATEGDTVVIVASASDRSLDFATVGNYTWEWTDGQQLSTSFGRIFTHTFAIPGIFPVTLHVIDGTGNAADATVVVVVADVTAPTPISGGVLAGDEGEVVRFDASNSSDNDPTFPSTGTFTWTLTLPGPGGSPTVIQLFGMTPTHIFSTPGRFAFVLQVTDRSGNGAAAPGAVEVRDRTPPQVHAGLNVETVQGSTVSFAATAADNDPSFATDPNRSKYTWSFDYGGARVTLEGAQTSFRFENTGVYIVTLTVSDAAGNTATDHIDIRVTAGAPDPVPGLQRVLVVAVLAATVLIAIPFWRRARRKGLEPDESNPK